MPAMPLDAVIGKNVVTFQFLCDIPFLEITPSLAEDECVICKDSYRNNGWKLGGTVHRPVKLRCGHVLGFQCLARWMLMANPVACCPLCREDVIIPFSTPEISERLVDVSLASLVRLETLAIVAGSGISQSQKTQLLRKQRMALSNDGLLWEFADGGDRVMVAWEELLNSMCKNESAAPSAHQTRQPLAAGAVAGPPRDNEVNLVLSHRRVKIALFFSFVAIAYVISGPIWDYFFARAHTVIATILAAWLWIVSTIVAYNLWRCRVPWKWDIALLGAMGGGVLFAGFVRVVDLWIYEWCMRGSHVVEHTIYWG